MIDTHQLSAGITDADESWRTPTPEPQFSDSWYFGLADSFGVGLYARIGRRANEGLLEGAVGLYLPDGRFVMVWARSDDVAGETIAAGPIHFVCDQPLALWRLLIEGRGRVFRRAADLLLAPREYHETDLTLELSFAAWTGPIAFMGSETTAAGGSSKLAAVARHHYEQPGRATGRLQLGEEAWPLTMNGMRDHSWGVRDWQAIPFWRWACVACDPALALGVSNVADASGSIHVGGWLLNAEGVQPIVRTVWSTSEDQSGWQKTMRLTIEAADGSEVELTGEAIAVAPLRQRRGSQVTHIGEALTRFFLHDREAYGIWEYLHQT